MTEEEDPTDANDGPLDADAEMVVVPKALLEAVLHDDAYGIGAADLGFAEDGTAAKERLVKLRRIAGIAEPIEDEAHARYEPKNG